MDRAVDMRAGAVKGRAWFPALSEVKVRRYLPGQGGKRQGEGECQCEESGASG